MGFEARRTEVLGKAALKKSMVDSRKLIVGDRLQAQPYDGCVDTGCM